MRQVIVLLAAMVAVLLLAGGVALAAALLRGTGEDDALNGTNGSDVIHGYGGNDTTLGMAGNDVMFGGSDGMDSTPSAGSRWLWAEMCTSVGQATTCSVASPTESDGAYISATTYSAAGATIRSSPMRPTSSPATARGL
jgi:Ca2+-binding RTX toxin-like protein